MKSEEICIRDVCDADAERLAEIYTYYVAHTAVSFEWHQPTAAEFRERIRTIRQKYPYLVCECGGTVIGYAYASAYSSREAYDWTAAMSIYVDRDHRRSGAGSALYRALEGKLKAQGIVNALAAVAYTEQEDEYLTHDSYQFHIRCGYTRVARLEHIGKKFDRWYDILWMEKVLIPEAVLR